MAKREVLDSWKDISAFLRRDIRTCQRWERELDLPVHRLDCSPRARVFAYRDELERWLEEKPHEREVSEGRARRTRRLKKLATASAGVLTLAAAGLLLWRLVSSAINPVYPPRRPTLAVLYFDNTSGDKSLEGWKVGLSDLLIEGISQSRYVNVLSSERLFSVLKKLGLLETKRYSTENLRRIAQESGVDHTVSGGFLRAGGKIIITLTVQKPGTGEIVRMSRVECDGEGDIIGRSAELIRQIMSDLALTPEQITQDGDPELGRVTTRSPEAFTSYSEGRRLHLQGNYRESILFMEKAVAIDPEFALAFRSMAAAYSGLGDSVNSAHCFDMAFRLSDRVSEKERMLIQGLYYAQREVSFGQSIEAIQNLSRLYPDAPGAGIALVCNRIEDWPRTVKTLEVQLRLGHPFVYYHLARAYMGLGSYDRARKVCRSYLDGFEKDNQLVKHALWGSYVSEGRYDEALREDENPYYVNRSWIPLTLKGDWDAAERLSRGEPAAALACVLLSKGRIGAAVDELNRVAQLAAQRSDWERESYVHALLAHVLLNAGRNEDALQESRLANLKGKEAGNYSLRAYAIDLMGTAHLRLGSKTEARTAADQLKALVDTFLNKKLMRHYFHLTAKIELEKGNPEQAVNDLARSVALLSGQVFDAQGVLNLHAYFMDSLAGAYYRAGSLDKSQKEYTAITRLGSGRLYHGDLYAKAFYMLGRIAERQGDKGRARESYGKFLTLWRDADPGIPEVEEARKRLAVL